MRNLFSSSHFSQYCNLNLIVLAISFLSIVYPLCLSFLPHLAGIIGLYLTQRHEKHTLYPYKNILIVLILICCLTSISSLWSVTPEISLRRSLKISAGIILFVPFLVLMGSLKEETIRLIKLYLPIPVIAGAVYLIIELAFGLPILKMFRGGSELVFAWQYNKHVVSLILLAPFGVLFSIQNKKFLLAMVVLLLCALVVWITDSQAAQLAALAIVLVVIGYRVIPSLMLPLCFGGVLTIFILMPWISQYAYNSFTDIAVTESMLNRASASQRLEIWDFVSRKILESPWIGFGVDTTRSIEFQGRMVYYQNSFVLHPHNIALQIWIEFGALGISLAGCLLLFLYFHLRKLSFHEQLLPVVIFLGVMVVMLVSWSIWAAWLIGLILLLVGFCRLDKPMQ